ncbi:MAG TPA: aspartate carbamoyltransferase catalytic subunit [Acidimicrobiales bacterium]|nr:aspartate carbamoyltransferase catalytic subunit [Acidimicrobiales bacterium]
MSDRHLLSIDDLGRTGIDRILKLADSFSEVGERPIPKVPALRGKTVATLFFEASTRTRLSFEAAAKRLSADTMTFTTATSSVSKGESLRDTVQTIDAMGVDAMVVRHSSAGVPSRCTEWTSAAVVNAGDGWHEHPTQALLDCYTIREVLRQRGTPDGMDGLRVLIVGDSKHSRVARSCCKAFSLLGAEVTLVGPGTLLPPSIDGWPCEATAGLDDLLPGADIVYMLRIQAERMNEALLPSLREYTSGWGLTDERARRLSKDVMVMHPGPMNRGVEISAAVADSSASLVTRQVHHGVAVRMAVLFDLLGSGGTPNG